MTTEPEQKLAEALDLLSDFQIVALFIGTVELAHYFIDQQIHDEHPIKHNVKARTNTAGLYQDMLHRELAYQLPERDPEKARRIADELSLYDDAAARQMAERMRERLRQAKNSSDEM